MVALEAKSKTNDSFVPSMPRVGIFRRLRRGSFRLLPLLVWAGAIAVVVQLTKVQSLPFEHPGLARVTRHAVTSPEDGLLETLVVSERQEVAAGQLLGRLDDEALLLRLRRARAELGRLQAEVAREEALRQEQGSQRGVDQQLDLRRFYRDRENAKLDLLDVRARQEEDKIRLEGLAVDLRRELYLEFTDSLSEAELIRTQVEHDALREAIAQRQLVLAGEQERLAAVEERLLAYRQKRQAEEKERGGRLEPILDPFRWQITVQEVELEEVALLRTRLSLRAPSRGLVEEISCRPGQHLALGQALLTIVEKEPRALVAFVPADFVPKLKLGMEVLVQRSTRPGQSFRSKVAGYGPALEQIPPRLLLLRPETVVWGMPVFLEPLSQSRVLPGEALRVSFDPNGKAEKGG